MLLDEFGDLGHNYDKIKLWDSLLYFSKKTLIT